MTSGSRPIDARVDIGHVHLKVADLDRALGFYVGVLGLSLMQRGQCGGVHQRGGLSPSHRLEHLGKRGGDATTAGDDGPLSPGHPVS